jgi:hypothetical protein
MTRDTARVVLAAHPQRPWRDLKKNLPITNTDRALRATIRHVMRQYRSPIDR